jgi:hypothetical protein
MSGVRREVVEAAFAGFHEILEAHGANRLEALLTAFCVFRDLESGLDQLWGAAAIGAAINQTPSQTHRLLAKGFIKCARRIGRRWVADSDELDAEFSTERPKLGPDMGHAA